MGKNIKETTIEKNISKSQIILNEFNNENDWYYLSAWVTLSEDIMEEFANKLHWEMISIYQNLSKFIRTIYG